jgi:PAS domain-containing protein
MPSSNSFVTTERPSEITENLRAESQDRYRTLFDLAPVAVYYCDASGVFRDYNSRAAGLWGRKPEVGDTDERFCGSFRMYRPDGSYMPVGRKWHAHNRLDPPRTKGIRCRNKCPRKFGCISQARLLSDSWKPG